MIFLSASIPDPNRNEKYFLSADVIAIRDAVRALATVVLPNSELVWGGHPAITPLIRYVMSSMDKGVQDRVTIYQSDFFKNSFPADNKYFERVIITEKGDNRDDSLKSMRLKMFNDHKYDAAFFIGGMEGVELEYDMFTDIHRKVPTFPIASTGAAAKMIYERQVKLRQHRFESDYAYLSLFRSILRSINKSN